MHSAFYFSSFKLRDQKLEEEKRELEVRILKHDKDWGKVVAEEM